MDIVDPATRSRMMSRIRGKNTKPELIIRKLLHAAGLRFRLHRKDLPGKPDIVLPRYGFAIFVNGCFWHGHQCSLFRMPSTNSEFWQNKIGGNMERDKQRIRQLVEAGWRVGVVWECSLRGKKCEDLNVLQQLMLDWIHGKDDFYQTDMK